MGAACLMLLLVYGHPNRLVSAARLVWFGGISYSLYLTHLIVLLTAMHAFGGKAPLPGNPMAVPLIAVVVASAAYYCVERPSMSVGRSLSERSQSRSGRPDERAAVAAS
jgi:peptidoglycan/LPS O-acetylase OafA/YrhL